MADTAFDFAFAIGIVDTARQRDRAVMFQHVAVEGIDGGIVDVGREHAFAEIIQDDDAGAAAEPAKGLLMQFRPDLRTGAEDQEAHTLAAITERQNKEPGAAIFTALWITDHGTRAVIDLSFFAGRGLDDRACFRRLPAADLVYEPPDALIAGRAVIGIYQILPDGFGIAPLG